MTENPTCLYADLHVDKYNEDPIVAAHKLAGIWCSDPTKQVDVWGCDWPCDNFFRTFLDVCREKGRLEQALGIWWVVHNCPGPETEPLHHDAVCQQVIDYSKEYGLEAHTEWLKPHGMDKYQNFVEIAGPSYYAWWEDRDDRTRAAVARLSHDIYPHPRDENDRLIPQLRDKRTGEVVGWPKGSDGVFLTIEQLDEQGI